MSEVLPGVFIGDDRAATDATLVRDRGITRVLNVADECGARVADDPALRVMWVHLLDSPDERLLVADVSAACSFIDAGVADGRGVLVHCRAGRSRSAMVVLAYLISRRSMSLGDAYAFLKAKRPEISPNLGYVGFLLQLTPGQRM